MLKEHENNSQVVKYFSYVKFKKKVVAWVLLLKAIT